MYSGALSVHDSADRFGPILRLPRKLKGQFKRPVKGAHLESGYLLERLTHLRHPNLMKVYEFDDEYVYVEYIEGLVLSNKHPNCPPHHTDCYIDHVRTVDLSPVRAAVEYLHANGVCHSDVNSHNILVTQDGVLKLIDMICCLPKRKAFVERDFSMLEVVKKELSSHVRVLDHPSVDIDVWLKDVESELARM
jgi:serine/threonine protein kinase